ncbi:alcohol dehydrogenase catalytic domain-containing protein [Pseudonocardia sp. DLS-67]
MPTPDARVRTRSLRFSGPGDVRLTASADRPLAPHEVRLRPLAVGVCGTDAHIVGGSFPAEPGVVLGHEVCGRVVEVGDGIDGAATPRVGDLVTVEPHRYCTACTWCRAGQEHLCSGKRGYGVRLDGGMAESMIVPARIAYALPPDTTPWVGALCEPVSCCVHAVDRLGVVSGEALLVLGCGPAGAVLVALGRLLGATPVVAADTRETRRELAQRMGADVVIDPRDREQVSRALALTGGEGYPAVVDAVGSSTVLEQALTFARRGGRVLEFGVAAPDDVAAVRPHDLFSRELTLLGSVINPWTHQRAVALLPRLGLDRLTAAFYGLHEFDEALAAQRRGDVDKVFVAPSGEAAARGG